MVVKFKDIEPDRIHSSCCSSAHAVPARPVARALCLVLVVKEHSVFFFHSLAGATGEKAIDLQLPVAGKGKHTGFEQPMKFRRGNIVMANHAASWKITPQA
jgi:hypothetical protein